MNNQEDEFDEDQGEDSNKGVENEYENELNNVIGFNNENLNNYEENHDEQDIDGLNSD